MREMHAVHNCIPTSVHFVFYISYSISTYPHLSKPKTCLPAERNTDLLDFWEQMKHMTIIHPCKPSYPMICYNSLRYHPCTSLSDSNDQIPIFGPQKDSKRTQKRGPAKTSSQNRKLTRSAKGNKEWTHQLREGFRYPRSTRASGHENATQDSRHKTQNCFFIGFFKTCQTLYHQTPQTHDLQE